ncbi:glutamate-gated chloride channel alpha-like isoform X1 [Macrobrachium rosenbergii]|uniref:glutamate-gated chloride channel alpha-like isoform X1 n=1 Tax=Macrobrachium rosenbergii TaxID=79674 RepID=UPI0034D72BD3
MKCYQESPNVITLFFIISLWMPRGRCIELRPPGYDRHLAPKNKDGGPVTIYLSVMISSVNEVNEKDMELILGVFFRTSWTDPRLIVPKDLFNETTESLVLSQEFIRDLKLWLPDPYIERVKKIETASMLQPFVGAKLHKNGKILISQMFTITLSCPMFFQDFPFDTQTCYLEIASYFYGIKDVTFGWHLYGIATSKDIPALLGDYEFEFKVQNTTVCMVPEYVTGNYPCLKAFMRFKRRFKNYLIGVYVPSLLFVAVAWASFFWPPEAVPARTVLLITCLLTMISLYSGVQAVTPPANYTRAIDVWFFACILAVAMALFQYAVILQLRCKQLQAPEQSTDVTGHNSVGPIMENLPQQKSSSTKAYWNKIEHKVELVARLLYLVAFFIFNILYWTIYLR